MDNKPNILLITADDMNWDAVGAFGCPVAGTTPNIDKLASDGIRFTHGHVTIAVCQPSRSVLMTGLYPHNNTGEGFFRLRTSGIPILPQILRDAGYNTGILGKVTHSTPYESYQWDMSYDMDDLGHGRNPSLYRKYTESFVKQSTLSGKPFFLMANSHDPHRPFYGNDIDEWYEDGESPPAVPPSRAFVPDEVVTPGFLSDLPDVRLEISEYYASVRRCDDTVGNILSVLDDTGTRQNTIVFFLSDNGMAFPFAKTNCYLNSTRTPWLVRWPETIKSGLVDSEHFISGVDFMPTVLDAIGIAPPPKVDGRTFLPVLRGQRQDNREMVFTQFHQTAARRNYPMRCVQTKSLGYIYNAWADGKRVFINESQNGRTFNAMKEAGSQDIRTAHRVDFFLHRALEELYDFANDPNALKNLIDDPDYESEAQRLRSALAKWMDETDDPAADAYKNRYSRQAQEALIKQTTATLGGI